MAAKKKRVSCRPRKMKCYPLRCKVKAMGKSKVSKRRKASGKKKASSKSCMSRSEAKSVMRIVAKACSGRKRPGYKACVRKAYALAKPKKCGGRNYGFIKLRGAIK